MSNNNNKFEVSAPTWNEEFELPDILYQNIQDYYKSMIFNIQHIKKHGQKTGNPSIKNT